jgi:hypothetical protein
LKSSHAPSPFRDSIVEITSTGDVVCQRAHGDSSTPVLECARQNISRRFPRDTGYMIDQTTSGLPLSHVGPTRFARVARPS